MSATKATKKSTAKKSKPAAAEVLDYREDNRPGKGLSLSFFRFEKAFSGLEGLMKSVEEHEDPEKYLTEQFGPPIEVHLKYGKKWLVRCFETNGDSEFRVCLVFKETKKGEQSFKVDAREWYNPES